MILEKSKKKLELNQSELDIIRMVLDFIILTLKVKPDFISNVLDSMKSMSWTTQLKRVLDVGSRTGVQVDSVKNNRSPVQTV
jgi:hypothetical protein